MSIRKQEYKDSPADKLDTGLSPSKRRKVADMLGNILSDTYLLTLKSHVFHWNVVGPLFVPLHELTQAHYENLFAAADEIAERIRALGHLAPNSFQRFLPRASVEEESGKPDAMSMVEHLIDDHERMTQRLRETALAADDADDLVTADLLTERLAFHEKAIWMLRAIAGK